jgi:glycosyltransferase involved in cell wall biosynthesis
MRVLHVLSNYGVSGVERHVEALATAQRQAGDSVGVLCDAHEFPAGALGSADVQVVVDPRISPDVARWPGALAPARDVALNRIREFAPDVVHVHARRAGTVVISPDLLKVMPVVYTNHSLGCSPFLLAEALQKHLFPVIAVCQASADQIRKRLGPRAFVRRVPNGVMPTSPSTSLVRKHESRQSVALVGSLIPRKGIDIALLALRVICDARGFEQTPMLHVFGRGGEKRELLLLSEQLGLENLVLFHGERRGVVNALLEVAAVIVPSREESAPLVLLEAMHAGVPVVASSVGGIPEILPTDDFGRRISVESYTELADGIMEALDAPDVTARRARNAQARYWSEYTAAVMAERTHRVYKEVVGD